MLLTMKAKSVEIYLISQKKNQWFNSANHLAILYNCILVNCEFLDGRILCVSFVFPGNFFPSKISLKNWAKLDHLMAAKLLFCRTWEMEETLPIPGPIFPWQVPWEPEVLRVPGDLHTFLKPTSVCPQHLWWLPCGWNSSKLPHRWHSAHL